MGGFAGRVVTQAVVAGLAAVAMAAPATAAQGHHGGAGPRVGQRAYAACALKTHK